MKFKIGDRIKITTTNTIDEYILADNGYGLTNVILVNLRTGMFWSSSPLFVVNNQEISKEAMDRYTLDYPYEKSNK